MKLLYVSGYSRMVIFNKLIPPALRRLGVDVHEFDWNSVLAFNKAVRLFSDATVKAKRNEALLAAARKLKPDAVFVLKGEVFEPGTLKQVKQETGALMWNWFGDDPWEYPAFSSRHCVCYDYFFTYDPWSVNLYRSGGYANAFHLPYGYDSGVADAVAPGSPTGTYGCDVAFIGSHYPERETYLSQLVPRFNLKIWGRGWKHTALAPYYTGKALYDREMLTAMKTARVVLNIHKGWGQGPQAGGEGINLRVMEAAACGAVQLVNNQPDVERRFIPGTEIASFASMEELQEQLAYYLSNPAAAAALGTAAAARVRGSHQLWQRMEEMFAIMGIRQ